MRIWRFSYEDKHGKGVSIQVGADSWEQALDLLSEARTKACLENLDNITGMKLVRVK